MTQLYASDGSRLTEIGTVDQFDLLAHPAISLSHMAHEQWMVRCASEILSCDLVCQTRIMRLSDLLRGHTITQLLVGSEKQQVPQP